MTDECSYDRCNSPAKTTLQVEGEPVPSCQEHMDNMVNGDFGQEQEDKGPDTKLKSGSVHLDIWKNEDRPDNYSFKRFYTEDNGDNFKETSNMRPRDLPHIANLVRKAMDQQVTEK